MAPKRRTPFSGKAKKMQLKQKKIVNEIKKTKKPNVLILKKSSDENSGNEEFGIVKINAQPSVSKESQNRNVNRYALHFYKETKAQIEAKKLEAQQPLKKVEEKDLEIDSSNYFPPLMNFPRRPAWDYNMSKEELDARENRYFREFTTKLEKEFGCKNLSYFELNLETWRQFWRVIEMSDIILLIVDIRFAVLMFPPLLYKFVCEDLKKNMILILNKIDLVPPDLIIAWKYYFKKHYPSLKILIFTSYPSYNLQNQNENKSGLKIRKKKGKPQMAAEGAQKLYEACKEITQDQVDLKSWADKIKDEMTDSSDDEKIERNIISQTLSTEYREHSKYEDGTLTIGCIGQPNVGKSSLINAIMGKKVVSISRTPGHTKHFQTIYLTKNVILCDCPGLVFPSLTPRTLQILNGSYPISQVREPYTAVKFLAERLNLPEILRLRHPEDSDDWSAFEICDEWAKKRGFFTAKTSRPDTYRAANNLLRMSLDGKICLSFKPPDYFACREKWLNHPEVVEVTWILARYKKENELENFDENEDSSLDEMKGKEKNISDESESSRESSPEPLVVNKFAVLELTTDE